MIQFWSEYHFDIDIIWNMLFGIVLGLMFWDSFGINVLGLLLFLGITVWDSLKLISGIDRDIISGINVWEYFDYSFRIFNGNIWE
jgi:uncharacterized membrane protein